MGGSVQAMMRAAGYTNEKEFFKAVEAGKVLTKDVLPKFSKELHKLAMSGGALEKTMQSTPAQFARFMTALTEAKLSFYDNGMNKGLAYMFKEMADLLQELNPLAEAFGNMFRGAISAVTAAVKVLAIPMRVIVRIFESFSNILKELGVEDGTGMLWRLVGAGGVLALMATRFSWITKAVWTLNTALLTTLARLAPFIAAYGAIEDVFLYMKYGDNANTITGTVAKGLKQSSNMGVGEIMQNMWAGYSRNSPLAMLGMIPEYTPTVEITVKDGEFSKAIDAKLQKKTATTQSEVAQ